MKIFLKISLFFVFITNFNIYSAAIIESQADQDIDSEDNLVIWDELLSIRAHTGNQEGVEEAIKNGANINAVDKDGTTALLAAINGLYIKIVEILLRAGADVNLGDDYETPLILAVRKYNHGYKKSKDIIKLLLLAGSDMNKKNANKKNAFDVARSECPPEYDQVWFAKYQQELKELLKAEANRRENFLKLWLKNNNKLSNEISNETIIISPIADLIAQYALDYTDIPINDRLDGLSQK